MSTPEPLFNINPTSSSTVARPAPQTPAEPAAGSLAGPLAHRMRPRTLEQFQGQLHLLGEKSPIKAIIDGDLDTSIILYGPPGTGKTTLAHLIASATRRHVEALSALDLTVKELRGHIDIAKSRRVHGRKTVLFIDEVHRFTKTQQDALLGAVENGIIMLIAATTENPSFSVVAPLLSRSLVLTLQPLGESDLVAIIDRALHAPEGLDSQVELTPEAQEAIIRLSSADARRALTILESCAQLVARNDQHSIDLEVVSRAIDQAVVRYDKNGDQHYDVISAFIKSIRGSDVDAALHYLARMISAGEDPRFIARRLVILASEDIGMADSQALLIAHTAAQTVASIGMPEARLTLAHAVIYLALAPKSNSVIMAIDQAIGDISSGKGLNVPPHLRDAHYSGAKKLGHGINYVYPHNHEQGVVSQQYIPSDLETARYYAPSPHGAEAAAASKWEKLRAIIRSYAGKGKGKA